MQSHIDSCLSHWCHTVELKCMINIINKKNTGYDNEEKCELLD